jgi:hypothetical protein
MYFAMTRLQYPNNDSPMIESKPRFHKRRRQRPITGMANGRSKRSWMIIADIFADPRDVIPTLSADIS